jgi:hypothetical protein
MNYFLASNILFGSNVLHVRLQRCEHGNLQFNHTPLLKFSRGCGGCAAMSSTRAAEPAHFFNKMTDLSKYLEKKYRR